MDRTRLALFETAIGRCGIAFSASTLRGVQLPEASAGATAERLAARFPGAVFSEPSGPAADAVAAIIALLGGEPLTLSDVVLDEDAVSAFDRKVYHAARLVLPGTTSTYGAIAAAIGAAGEARAVGQSLGRNPWPIVVPCHRILAAGGKVGGFSGAGGIDTKLRMLTIERARTDDGPSLFSPGELPLAAPRPSGRR